MDSKKAVELVKTDPEAAFDLLLGKTAAAEGWGFVVDEWMETTLKSLLLKATRYRKVKLTVLNDVYSKGVAYYRAALLGKNDKGVFNLNLHLEYINGPGMTFIIELHQGQDLTRLAATQQRVSACTTTRRDSA